MQQIVNVQDVSLKYQSANGEIDAITNINFKVAEGEFVSIVGPSGCGKSTLLSLIAGLLEPTSGKIYVAGKQITKPSPEIGFMPQKDHLFEWRSVYKNVLLGLEVQHSKNSAAISYVNDLLKTYGLFEFKNKYPAQLSGGMRQRVALIRTLATSPEILLLDEPFSSLDYQTRLGVADDIYKIIKSEHKTAIMVTHDISEAISVSDRVIVLSKRPSVVKSIHNITFEMEQRIPFACREEKIFQTYFNKIWKELDVHV